MVIRLSSKSKINKSVPVISKDTMSYVQKLQIVEGKYVYPRKIYRPYKLCKNCQHYNKNGQSCRLFTSTDLVTGVEQPVQALSAREDMSLCGYGGQHYEALKQNQDGVSTNVLDNLEGVDK
jgi:hypothetical protein